MEIYKHYFASINGQVISIRRRHRNKLHKHVAPILKRLGKQSRTSDLSLLGVCRTVYQEAIGLVYQDCHLAFWLWDAKAIPGSHDNVIVEVSMFKSIFKTHLTFIQHLDLGLEDLIRFVPTPVIVEGTPESETDYPSSSDRTLTRLLDATHNNDRAKGSYEERQLIPFLIMLGTSLPNVRSITYHQYWEKYNMYRTPSPQIKEKLKNHFPKLEKVRILRRVDEGLKMTIVETNASVKDDEETMSKMVP